MRADASLPSDARARIAALHAARPRSRFLRVSAFLFGGLLLVCLFGAVLGGSATSSARRARNWARFTHDVTPRPLRDGEGGLAELGSWAGELMGPGGGWAATGDTLALSVLAILLAACFGLLFALPAARNFMAPWPFGRSDPRPSRGRRWLSAAVVGATRFGLVLMRSLPEFILAFLFLDVFGHSAWPAVLALALHNAGILGRLNGETIENMDPAPARALRDTGARRAPIAWMAVFPAIAGRALLYLFYRWETCVREATVLGMLNIPSIGRHVDDALASGRKDELLFFVLIGAAIVWMGDLLSGWVRARVRDG